MGSKKLNNKTPNFFVLTLRIHDWGALFWPGRLETKTELSSFEFNTSAPLGQGKIWLAQENLVLSHTRGWHQSIVLILVYQPPLPFFQVGELTIEFRGQLVGVLQPNEQPHKVFHPTWNNFPTIFLFCTQKVFIQLNFFSSNRAVSPFILPP